MIEMEMDPEALPVYDASATHQEWKARYGKYIQTKTILITNKVYNFMKW